MRRSPKRAALATAVLLATSPQVALLPPALANHGSLHNFNVDTTADAPDAAIDGTCDTGGGVCSLRAAIMEANANTGVVDRVHLPAGVYTLTRSSGDDTALFGDLDITEGIQILGAGSALTVIDGFANDRVLDILPGAGGGLVTINNLTVFNGRAVGNGGGIRIGATGGTPGVSMLDVRVVGNTATGDGGGIWAGPDMFVNGDWEQLVIEENHADGDGGGAWLQSASGTLLDSSVLDNTAGGNGGGLHTSAASNPTDFEQVTIAGNVSEAEGGGWYWADGDDRTPSPQDLLTISGNAAVRGGGITVAAAATVDLSGLTVVGNTATTAGAGIHGAGVTDLTIDDAIIQDNIGPGAECSGTHVASTLSNAVVGDCPLGTLVDVTTGITGGLGPLEAPAGRDRAVVTPDPSHPGVDTNDSCAKGLEQPPLVGTATPCDTGATEAPVLLVADVTTDTAPGDATTCVDGVSPCSLRGALEIADAYNVGNDTIVEVRLVAGTYALTEGQLELVTSHSSLDRIVRLAGAGRDATVVDAGQASRVLDYTGSNILDVRDLTLTGGVTGDDGGGLRFASTDSSYSGVELTRVGLVDNLAAGSGGGLAITGDVGYATLREVMVTDNSAEFGGGVWVDGDAGIGATKILDSHFEHNGFEDALGLDRTIDGGAFHCSQGTSNCPVTIQRTLFVENVAARHGGAVLVSDGGTATDILNNTFLRNHVGPDALGSTDEVVDPDVIGGGALASFEQEGAKLVHNTWVGNTSQGVGGGFYATYSSPGTPALFDVYANAMHDNRAATAGDHCFGDFSEGADNIATSAVPVADCSDEGVQMFTVVADLELGPLADNGGPQQTLLPSGTSPLIDGSTECVTSSVATTDDDVDARGAVRARSDGSCDVGAVEVPKPEANLEAEVRWARSPAIVPLRNLPDDAVTEAFDAARDAADGGVASTPMSAIDINASPMSAIPMSAIPMSAIVLQDLPFASLPLSTLLLTDIDVIGGWDPILAGSGLQNVPLQTLTLEDVLDDTTARSRFEALDLADVGIASTPMSAIPMSAIAMGAVPMSAIPIVPANAGDPAAVLGDWCTLLDALGYPCADLGINPASPSTANDWSLAAVALAGVPMSAIPMSAIPMSAIDISATPMSAIPMSAIDINATPMSAIPMSAIDISGTPMSAIPMSAIPMSAIPMSAIPMSAIPMSAITITGSPMSAIPMSAIPAGTLDAAIDCSLVDCVGGTLQDAFDAGAFRADATVGDLGSALAGLRLSDMIAFLFAESLDAANAARNDPEARLTDLAPYDDVTLGELFAFGEMTLGELVAVLEAAGLFGPGGALEGMTLDDLLGGLLPFTDYPWEDIDLDSFDAQLYANDATPIPYTLNIAAVDPLPGFDLDLVVDLPAGFVYVPGSTNSSDGFGEPTVTDVDAETQQLRWELRDAQRNVVPLRIEFSAFPGLGASADDATITASLPDYGTQVSKQATVFVFESLEPNDTVAQSTPADPDTLYVTQVSHPDDLDIYEIEVDAGDQLSIVLSDLPADYDLVLFSPDTEPAPLRDATERLSLPIDDEGLDLLRPANLEPQPLDDLNLGDRYVTGTGLDVYGTSARRGLEEERIDTPPLPRAGTYRIQVSGYDGAFSTEPYTLRMTVRPGPSLPSCDPVVFPFAGEGVVPAAPVVPAGIDTVILVNQSRLGDAFGAAEVTAADGLMDQLDDFVTGAAGDGVDALVYPVDSSASVRDAYAAWDADTTCHPDTANDVVREIGALITTIRATATGLENVVVVGADDQIPFARVPDRTSLANETSYAATFTGNNHLAGSLARGFLLSDEPYGDAAPQALGARDFFVTDLALGRVVESIDEIEAAFATFLAFDGLLAAGTGSSAFVGGYDFLTDGADEVAQMLAMPPHDPDPPFSRTVETLISETWDRAALQAELFDGDNDIASVNAHFDHFRSLPAAGNATHDESDLFEVSNLAADAGTSLDGTVLFSMGCHSGLSVSDIQIVAPGDVATDWASSFATAGAAAWAANSGFGYGDTEVVALSESLMAGFAQHLDGTSSIGAAFAHAKQQYAANLGANGAYDEKVVMEATFYGLPMYRIEDPLVPPPVLPDEPTSGVNPALVADGGDTDSEPDLVQVDFTAATEGALVEVTGPRGTHLSFPGSVGPQTQVTHFRPIQPLGTWDLTFMDPSTGELRLDLRGAMIRSMETTAVDSSFDPVIARPILADGATEFEPRVGDVVFPSSPVSVRQVRGPAGHRTQLNVLFGQFRGGAADLLGSDVTGEQKTLDNFDLDLYFGSVEETDILPPRIDRVDAWQDSGNIRFRLEVTDASSLRAANVLFIPTGTTGTWTEVTLADGGALANGRRLFTGTATDPNAAATGSIEYLAQVLDDVGNVGVSTNKGVFHTEEADAPFTDAAAVVPTFLYNGAPATSAWFDATVTVTLQDFPAGTTLSVDGGEFTTVGAGIDVAGDGVHLLVARQTDGEEFSTLLRIDGTPPTVQVVDPVDGVEVFQSFPPEATATCDDALSGIRTCEVTAIDTSTLGAGTVTATAVDFAGNVTEATGSYTVVADVPELFDPEPVTPTPTSPTPEPEPEPDPEPTVDPEPEPDPEPDQAPWPDEGVNWLFGSNRYETAAELALARHPAGAEVVYIGTGTNFPDLLSLASLSDQRPGPVLLVGRDSIPSATYGALEFLQPRHIVVVGGPGVVSEAVYEQLRAFTPNGGVTTLAQQLSIQLPPIERVAGKNRYGTAAAVARRAHPDGVERVVLVTGEAFPDAMVAGPYVSLIDAGVLLTTPTGLPLETATALALLEPNEIIVIGGPNAVSEATLAFARLAAVGCSPVCREVTTRRITGANRYATAKAVSDHFPAPIGTVYVAGGAAWADGLGLLPLAQQDLAPVLLVSPDGVPPATQQALERLRPQRIAIVGGPGVVGESVATELRRWLRAP